jgi:hypothetical protein
MKLAKRHKGLGDIKASKPRPSLNYNIRAEKPLNADKGDFDGSCNRRDCQRPGSRYWNRWMNSYYCRSCALSINAGIEPETQCFPGMVEDTEDRRKSV